MSETVGFSGTRHVTDEIKAAINKVFLELNPGTTVVTGACVGVDAYVAYLGWVLPFMKVHTIVPANQNHVDPYWQDHCDTFERMPLDTDYRARNERIVELSDRLIAFPERPEDDPRSRRSGTWMTIRIARRAGKPVQVEPRERRQRAAQRDGGSGG